MTLRALFSFSIVSFTLMFASLLGATPLNQSYYKNPGWDAFLAASDEMIQEIADTKDAHELEHALNKASIFIAHVLNQKPESSMTCLKIFLISPSIKKRFI